MYIILLQSFDSSSLSMELSQEIKVYISRIGKEVDALCKGCPRKILQTLQIICRTIDGYNGSCTFKEEID